MNAGTASVLGVLEWFEVGEEERVERVLERLRELGVRHLRTGVSWADWHTPGGGAWYDWLLPRLAREVEVLPCVLYTPPSLGVAPKVSAPPREPKAYADFLDVLVDRSGEAFTHVELWNEPNSRAEWDWTLDPEWHRFCEMIGGAAYWLHERGKRVVLGGMSPIDPNWLALLGERGVLEHVDVVGVHGFPGTWELAWEGWDANVAKVRQVLRRFGSPAEVWITEVGYSTWKHDELGQLTTLLDALAAPVERVYWYAAEDLAAERSAVGRFHEDEREYHFGLARVDGEPKLLGRVWAAGGVEAVRRVAALDASQRRAPRIRGPHVLITGGAGFVGTNLADRLLSEGRRVVVLDNLARTGVERNLAWLAARHGSRLRAHVADVRDRFAVREALADAEAVYHFAAQVAVTTSVVAPDHDFGVNVGGTVTLLEELRRLAEPPPLLFTSTNKVYGALPELPLVRDGDRWEPLDRRVREHGIGEEQPLAFCTPYGCSKGAADQYVLDYAKSFDLPTVVFRMSCIYGPHQHGTEDQGWVAHFLLRALAGEPITIYGDGAQVRDLLFVEDLVEALQAALAEIDVVAGCAFNVGGGPESSVSLLEVLDLIGELTGESPAIVFAEERIGDQRYYVSDARRLARATGWEPRVAPVEGLGALYRWLVEPARPRSAAVRASAR